MGFQLSPGVNVTERDLTTIVPAVATTNAAFAGLFSWGPVNKIVLIDSENNLVRNFGLPNDTNYQWFFSAANFLAYGNNLSVVRCLKNTTAALNAGAKAPVLVKNEDTLTTSTGVTTYGPFIARYPGTLGNSLGVEICGATGTTTGTVAFDLWPNRLEFNARPGTSEYISSLGGSGDGLHVVVTDRLGLWSGATGTVLERYENLSLNPDAFNADNTNIYYRNVINLNSRYILCPIDLAESSGQASGWTAGALAGYTSQFDSYTYGGTGTYAPFGVVKYNLNGGADESAIGSTGFADIAFGDASGNPSGYDMFKDAETVDVNLIIGGPEYQPSTVGDLQSNSVAKQIKDRITDVRKDCVLFCSAPISNPTLTETIKKDIAIAYRNTIGSSSYVFIDSGYKYMYDIYNDKYRWVPMNGDIAGLCARSDANTDPWFSPAGFNRGQVKGVVKLAFNPSLTFRDELYKNNINPVVTFPGEGTVLYGDKTAQAKPSAFDRINVRRLFIVLEKAIATASKYSLFEFNDSFTRAQFRSLVEPFLRDVQSRRGITDFKVVCDEKNNTPEVIDSNRFVADIYIKPARSINFIQLNFIATKTGVSFSEVGA